MYWKTRVGRGGGGGGQESRQTHNERIMVDGHTVTIDDLDPLTEYSVMVVGVNSAGTGQFSKPVTVVTEGLSIVSPGTATFSTVITQGIPMQTCTSYACI